MAQLAAPLLSISSLLTSLSLLSRRPTAEALSFNLILALPPQQERADHQVSSLLGLSTGGRNDGWVANIGTIEAREDIKL